MVMPRRDIEPDKEDTERTNSMPSFIRDGVEIAFLDEGQGEPIVLVHGFASNKEVNWVAPGWVSTLTRAGRRVIALDNRGHGQSSKLYDPAAYHSSIMAEDVRGLIEHLGFERADVMGYSMGARNTAFLALAHPDRTRSAVLGGLGMRLVEGVRSARHHRRRFGGAARHRHRRSDGLSVSRLCRADQVRPARARCVPARLAADAEPR